MISCQPNKGVQAKFYDCFLYEHGNIRPQGYLFISDYKEEIQTEIDYFLDSIVNTIKITIPVNDRLDYAEENQLKEIVSFKFAKGEEVLVLDIPENASYKETMLHWYSIVFGKEFDKKRMGYLFSDYILKRIRELGIRLVIIKNLDNFNYKQKVKMQVFMNEIKHITNELNISSVLFGTEKAIKFLFTEQFFSRFHTYKMEDIADKEYFL